MLRNFLFIPFLICLFLLPLNVLAARPHEFKLCHQSSFCRRLRGIADRANDSGFHSPYSLGAGEVTKLGAGAFGSGESVTLGEEKASWTFPLHTELYPEIGFELRVDFIAASGPTAGSADSIARVRVDEVGSKTSWRRYDEASKWALVDPRPELAERSAVKMKESKRSAVFSYGEGGRFTLEIEKDSLRITFKQDGVITMVINDRKLFHMEHFRLKEDEQTTPAPAVEGEEDVQVKVEDGAGEDQKVLAVPTSPEDGQKKRDTAWFEGELDIERWQESWKQWHDAKPKGPEGFAFDVSFPGSQHIYGLAEHASPLSLRTTDGSEEGAFNEPYRMWNVDIFEYDADSPMALYGAIPMVHAQNPKSSVGLLNLVASETLVDVKRPASGLQTHWISESGIIDLFILPGPSPDRLFSQYASLTGTTPRPPLWSIAYHQCRWNYLDTSDVLDVQRRFDEEDIPLDVTWLDIEYAEEHRYFDWDKKQFPDPVKMQEEVGAMGRKMVAIVDPHIKKTDSFRVYTDAQEKDIIVKRNDKTSNFNGWCWTGDSVWVDFFNPKSLSWWKEMFSFKVWKDSTKFLHIWNDMNEPSVFDGPEISMPRDNIHQGGWEHRDVHNINGLTFQKATFEAMVERESPAKRPFVLSRSFYPGSQRYGAIWTGDNMGTWDHFSGQTAMLLSLGICGMNFAGADVGGFFGNPSTEMLVRWYQAGAFMPFFRAHAHIDTKRREPYLYDEPYKGMMRDTIRLRYQMLPLWYTAFQETETTGAPILRSQHALFPHDVEGFGIDDQYYVGSSGLLVKPITRPGLDSAEVYLSDNQPYYNYFSNNLYPASKKSRRVKVPAPLDTLPLLVQGGSILPLRSRVRRASTLMWRDPFTLIIAVGVDGSASGRLYLDDGDSYDYKSGQSILREFKLKSTGKSATLSSKSIASASFSSPSSTSLATGTSTWATGISTVRIEQVIILGLSTQPKTIHAGGVELDFTWEAGVAAGSSKEGIASRLVVKDPKVKVVEDWEIVIA